MQTGFEIMDYDKNLKELWIKRLLAGIIDFSISLTISFTVFTLFLKLTLFYSLLLQGVVWYIYSAIFDMYSGKTPGKYPFGIRAVAFIGNLTPMQALTRNLTKLNGILVLGDVVAGLSTEGDPRQRYIERVVDSLVINERKRERRINRFNSEEKHREELVLPK